MKKAFRDSYNRELALLYERSREFAEEFPGIADRLGGLMKENLDPAVAGLLEGTAFMAARVQLKLDEEFRSFTTELLEQIFPDALAPTPSVMLVEANPPFDNKDLDEGLHFPAGAYLDARFVDADRRVSCRFRLCSPLSIWPLAITGATYHSSPAQISALGSDVATGTQGGVVIDILRPSAKDHAKPAGPLAELPIKSLPIYLTGDMLDAIALYEQIHCDLNRLSLRYLDKHGDPAFIRLNPDQIEQVGFGDEDHLFPHDGRLFNGFATLREAFAFPRKFLGFRLTGLGDILPRITAGEMQIVMEFGTANKDVASRVTGEHFRLHSVPAVNLFEESASQVRLDKKRHEFVVTPDSSPLTHYEIHQVLSVYAHYAGAQSKVPVYPLYALPQGGVKPRQALYFTTRRKQRRLTQQERRFGARHRYRGTETFISIYEPEETEDSKRAQRLQVRALCSNRHLPEYLPLAQSIDDFHLCDDVTVNLTCVAGPTRPREAMTEIEKSASHRATEGDNYWRLISYLSLNHYGLEDRSEAEGGNSLREMLSLFADISDTITETQLQGLRNVETRPVVRTIRRGDGFHAARGLEIRVIFDEAAFEGNGVILLGAILDRFLAEYASVNSFTQVITASIQRGDIKVWPPRTGKGPLL
ncbi:MAG: type VI secretion system baseplate subunit TssF [Paracoccaceae bacterium]